MVRKRSPFEERKERLIFRHSDDRDAPETVPLTEGANLRASERHPKHYSCRLRTGEYEFDAVLKNISETGALICGTGLHNVTTDTAILNSTITGRRKVRVVWHGQDEIGVAFF